MLKIMHLMYLQSYKKGCGMACEIIWNESSSNAASVTCVMTMGNRTLVSDYHHCGKPAKFVDPSNNFTYCGLHRKVADRANTRGGKSLCVEINAAKLAA